MTYDAESAWVDSRPVIKRWGTYCPLLAGPGSLVAWARTELAAVGAGLRCLLDRRRRGGHGPRFLAPPARCWQLPRGFASLLITIGINVYTSCMRHRLVAPLPPVGHTLYSQVAEQLEALVLAGPLGEETVLPPEWALAEQLAVSRGTLRRALAELEERGLLRREAGRGTFVNPAARLRHVVWRRLAEVARPDSRFGLDFTSFIPDFDGSDLCAESVAGLPEYQSAATVAVMPDNNLESLRSRVLADGKRLLTCTYALARGFVLLDGRELAAADRALAATLDGMERFATPLAYAQLCALGQLDLVVTGAAAVTREGVHFGKGHGYFDIEWGLLREVGLVAQRTPVVASVHGCQVVEESVPHAVSDATVDVIVTPTQVARCRPLPKPAGLFWERLPRDFAESRPYFAELRSSRGHRHGAA